MSYAYVQCICLCSYHLSIVIARTTPFNALELEQLPHVSDFLHIKTLDVLCFQLNDMPLKPVMRKECLG